MSQKNIREKLDELQAIVDEFEREELSIEQALERFDTGSKLAESIEAELGDLKTKITVLKERFDQE